MPNQTKFQSKWLEKVDCNNNIVSEWTVKIEKDLYSCICNICNATFSIDKGFEKINQHAKTVKHKSNLFKLKKNNYTLAFKIRKPNQ